ncbi:hypothetical protein [Pseudoalteromonas sp. H105]|uniref:hypothetical protein n=1 Tax=Pseudoalteromonas sp. H105 TaxID=1348393 RepID=UPI000731F903|nr:hypothetical protein [Pseudoalteromonas sp. H105]KTF16048.1 hypothetical protein ATS75_06490 [Pseudoalteromonas sp. H105]
MFREFTNSLKKFICRLLTFTNMRHMILLAFITCLQSCSNLLLPSLKNTNLTVNGIVFKNASADIVDNITLKVFDTGKYINCNSIQIDKTCSTTFPLRKYQNNALTVTWMQKGITYSQENFIVNKNDLDAKSVRYLLFITVNENGKIMTQFKPTKLINSF